MGVPASVELRMIPNAFQAPVFHYRELDSTMAEAKRVLRHLTAQPQGSPTEEAVAALAGTGGDLGNPPETLVFRAEHQTAGRGRLAGRHWNDVRGSSLLVTVARRRSGIVEPGPTAIRTGLAVAGTIEHVLSHGPTAQIKWPNDVLIDGRKISGVLIEAIPNWYLIGIGINIGQRTFPGDLRTPATSLRMELDRGRTPPVADELLRELLRQLHTIEHAADWRLQAEQRLAGRGRVVRFRRSVDESVETGMIAGLAEDGALLLKREIGTGSPIRCYSGEIESV
jgi:BirA family biotin operon repressor/biotin-[acetyl-CoA-carboxylase] ligase